MKLPIFVCMILSAANAQQQQKPVSPLEQELDRVARVAEAMVDGDLARRIETPRSARLAVEKDPRDPWKASDGFDVDHAAFTQMKRTLIRLSSLCPAACDVNLWMPLPADASKVQILIRQVNELSQFWRWGDLNQPVPLEMKAVLATGRRSIVKKRPGMISVLSPVRDSLDDIAGIVEVVAAIKPDPRENVK